MTEQQEQFEKPFYNEKKYHLKKYLLIFFGSLLGAFLAFYFAVDLTLKTFLSPEFQMRRAEKMMNKFDREMIRKSHRGMFMPMPFPAMKSPVTLEKVKNNYVITVDLKLFGNDPANIKFHEDDGFITVAGEMKKSKRNSEKLMSFSQSYFLNDKIDDENIVQKTEKNNYIITIPIKK